MKNISKTIYIYLFLIVLTVILIFTVGFKLILNSSIFIANFFNNKKEVPFSKTTETYGSLTIDNIPVATNTPEIVIGGSVINYEKIQFYLNEKKVKEIKPYSSDSFSETIGDLKEGNNSIYLKASTSDKNSVKKSDTFNVLLKTTMPKLEISEPSDTATVSDREISIKGQTDKEVFVKVNELPVTVDVNGNFQTTVRLTEGENKISVTAEDIASNIESKILTITYQKED